MICKECNKPMIRYGQVAICGNKGCKQYGVRILIGDSNDT